MKIEFNLRNLSHIFWTIVISLNLYVLLLLYRISKLYRSERAMKLQAAADLKLNIENMRKTVKSGNKQFRISKNPISVNNVNGQEQQYDPEQDQRTISQTHKASSTSLAFDRSDGLQRFNTDSNLDATDEHKLYISDSYGRVIQEISFTERDYKEALQSVFGDQHWRSLRREPETIN